jgi:hypothetical protein
MKEKNRNILKFALSNLPSFQVGRKGLWESIQKGIEIENKGDKLKKAIEALPSFAAPVGLWSHIEEQLSGREENLRTAIGELPAFNAPAGIWEEIEGQVSRRRRSTSLLYETPVFKVAASIVLLLSLTYLAYRFHMPVKDETINMHVEIIDDANNQQIDPIGAEAQPVLNSQLCKGNPQLCNSPQYKQLDMQLKELQVELNKIIELPGSRNDPQLLKYYYRLENERIEIEKRMIKLIIQS